jgi:hypothetical protein
MRIGEQGCQSILNPTRFMGIIGSPKQKLERTSVSSNACSGRSAGLSMSQKQRACGSWRPNPRLRLTFDESPLRESCTVGSVGEVPGNWHLYPTSTSAPSRALASVTMSVKLQQGSASRKARDRALPAPAAASLSTKMRNYKWIWLQLCLFAEGSRRKFRAGHGPLVSPSRFIRVAGS